MISTSADPASADKVLPESVPELVVVLNSVRTTPSTIENASLEEEKLYVPATRPIDEFVFRSRVIKSLVPVIPKVPPAEIFSSVKKTSKSKVSVPLISPLGPKLAMNPFSTSMVLPSNTKELELEPSSSSSSLQDGRTNATVNNNR